ncbi:cysteine synthase B [Marivirga tractuosa]|uniref:Cysteine synthase n=1 Tax=Marivirga tractuosa (strain ATCC 23168 / DSM 4126 / NBRC 15989 / NCIMB 1408 / VKM B-1430 / H-43) TaxID=643867 RepID=E4TUT0_MARTH|nr:cysteine synthase CysM [Marivirga tractuosa]ADR20058.1 cysteine synthase [Marivirga tractuosa DSM 4126]BDD15510.1 cysteine synthase B [Marivirga tractuosa]
MFVEDLVGNTPIVELKNIPTNKNVKIYCKLEGQNPGGSVKDRAALGMIGAALKRGDIKPGDKLVEATSGNTGIALAMIAKLKGLHMTLIMPENSTAERIQSMEAYGAEVILTKAEGTIEYSRTVAEEMAATGEYYMLNQFGNPDNYKQHYKTTGPEIWKDTNGEITHFVSAMGTTGTIMGVSRFLKEQNPSIQIVGTQPTDGSRIPGIRRWSPEFLPKIFEADRVDKTIDISEENATKMTQRMAKEEGILAGMSSGGALYAALQIAEEIESGVIVCITCDRGDRYLSSGLFKT